MEHEGQCGDEATGGVKVKGATKDGVAGLKGEEGNGDVGFDEGDDAGIEEQADERRRVCCGRFTGAEQPMQLP